MKLALLVASMILVGVSGCTAPQGSEVGNMNIISVFRENEPIPVKYTCDSDDVSPPLEFSNIPASAKSLALVVDDPDAPAGTWVHWVVWNIPPGAAQIGENRVPENAVQGLNDFGNSGYGGPCPPSGTHRYRFKLYALDATLDLAARSTKAQLEQAMKEHILEETVLTGVYSRV